MLWVLHHHRDHGATAVAVLTCLQARMLWVLHHHRDHGASAVAVLTCLQARLRAALAKADALNAATARLFRSFVVRQGVATVPLGTLEASASSSASASGGSTQRTGPAGHGTGGGITRADGSVDPEAAWQAVHACNSMLNPLLPKTAQGSGSRGGVLGIFAVGGCPSCRGWV